MEERLHQHCQHRAGKASPITTPAGGAKYLSAASSVQLPAKGTGLLRVGLCDAQLRRPPSAGTDGAITALMLAFALAPSLNSLGAAHPDCLRAILVFDVSQARRGHGGC